MAADIQQEMAEELCAVCHLLYTSGLTHAAGGNASARDGDAVVITPTGVSLARMRPEDLVRVRLDGEVVGPGQPSKEVDLHLAMYRARPEARAVIHPHPAHAVALSARHPAPRLNALAASNPGFYVRAGQVPQLPYLRSGSAALRGAVELMAGDFPVMVLGNHGLLCAAPTILDAYHTCEEIEQNCRIILLAGDGARMLTPGQCAEIDEARGRRWPEPAAYAELFAALTRAD